MKVISQEPVSSAIVGTASGNGMVVVCGGAVIDCIARPYDGTQIGASRTSLPGEAKVALGGVGRNIADVISRLGGKTQLVSVVGNDDSGRQLIQASRDMHIGVEEISCLDAARTATYTALLDGTGELVGAIADMSIFDMLTPSVVDKAAASLSKASLVICDANLQAATLQQVLLRSSSTKVPVWFEPVSTAKAPRCRCKCSWHLISPNMDELFAILGKSPEPVWKPTVSDKASAKVQFPVIVQDLIAEVFQCGIAENILLSLGPRGVVLGLSKLPERIYLPPSSFEIGVDALIASTDDKSQVPPLSVSVELLELGSGKGLWYRLNQPMAAVKDVTGAGDALLAGTAYAFTSGQPLERAVIAGMLCAHLTLLSDGAVSSSVTASLFARFVVPILSQSRL